jgi:hypothetical protein
MSQASMCVPYHMLTAPAAVKTTGA